ncbi:Peter Pan-like protein [Astathelohania contejeani]|uniref:U3 small nucleolar ribonucleoprotein protein IMP4 n=1 Tax=Astathelohania contejeani TaxID=164912 RepID=A0ABQ7I0C9_9MICR|nr:Peter Pan-like protein [Thelohania contejeani]
MTKLILRKGKADKRIKQLISDLRKAIGVRTKRKIIESNKFDIKPYIELAKSQDIEDFIIISQKKELIVTSLIGNTVYYKIKHFTLIKEVTNTLNPRIYKNYPLVEFTGFKENETFIKNFDIKTNFKKIESLERVVQIYKNENDILFRHYLIRKNEEGKVNLKEIGPRLTLEWIKTKDGFYNQK